MYLVHFDCLSRSTKKVNFTVLSVDLLNNIGHADIHSYRTQYAANLYKSYARNIRDTPYDSYTKAGHRKQSDVFACRKDLAGMKLDRKAMDMVSLALGHSRDDVVAQSYMYLLKQECSGIHSI